MAQAFWYDSHFVNHSDLVRDRCQSHGLDRHSQFLAAIADISNRRNNLDISGQTIAFVDEYRKIPALNRQNPISGNGASDET